MKTSISLILLTVLFSSTFTSCFYDMWVEGNGEIVEVERTVPEFEKIASSGSFDIYFELGDETGVTLSGESNLLPYIETVVVDNELKIRTPINVNIRPHETIEVHITSPYVEEIALSGSGLIHTGEIDLDQLKLETSGSGVIETTFLGEDLEIDLSGSGVIDIFAECDYTEVNISGSGKVYLEGSANDARYDISGSGNFMGFDFAVNQLEIDISGSGNMEVWVIDELYIDISGSGNIYYIGSPNISTNISGSGHLYDEN